MLFRLLPVLISTLFASYTAAVELTYATRNFDYYADYAGATARGDGTMQELGFRYNDHEYFELMGVLQESDTKQDMLLGIIIGDMWVEYRTGQFDFVVESDGKDTDSFAFSEEVSSDYQRIDLYFLFHYDDDCDGDIIDNEICRQRTGISYITYTAPVDITYKPYNWNNDADYYDEEYSYIALESKVRSIGMGSSIDFEPKSFGLYRRWSSHIGVAEAQYNNVKTICCSQDAADEAEYFEGDTSSWVWHIDYYVAVGLALNVPLSDNGARIMGSLSYDWQGNYTLPFLLFAELELEEGDDQMNMVNSWHGVRAALNVIF